MHPCTSGVGELIWSVEREAGWCAALQSAGMETKNMAFHPDKTPGKHHDEHRRAACELASRILRRPDIRLWLLPMIMR
jgi:hypothetical protein